MTDPTLTAPLRVGSVQFEAGAKVADVQAAIDSVLAVNRDLGAALEQKEAELAIMLEMSKTWQRFCDPHGPFDTLGLIAENGQLRYQLDQIKVHSAPTGAANAAAHAEVKRLREALEKIAKDGSCPNGDVHLQRIARQALSAPPTPDDAGWKDRALKEEG